MRHLKGYKGARVLAGALVLFFVLSGVSLASSPPEVAPLIKINGFYYPKTVAADSAGNIFVADPAKNEIKIHKRNGGFFSKINLAAMPYGIGVSPDDNLYVGVQDSILIYDKNRNNTGSIAGVKYPIAIDFASTGEIYVFDSWEFSVKVFSPDGAFAFSFGGRGETDGKFLGPVSLTLDRTSGHVYVLDNGRLVTDPYSTTQKVYAPVVQVFDLGGNFLRSFTNYGHATDGKISSASGIAVDEQGRVYISDPRQNIVVVYDTYGTHLKTIYDAQTPLYHPLGISYKDNKLIVVCNATRDIRVFGIDGYTEMGVSPSELSFTAQSGWNPPPQDVTISNSGPGALSWQAAGDASWMVIPSEGTVGGNSSGALSVGVDATGLSKGAYTGMINITTAGAAEQVKATLTVAAPPQLSVSPASFSAAVKKQDAPPSFGTNIELTGDLSNALSWSATSDAGWLAISPEVGPSNALTTATISVNHTGLAAGHYEGTITVEAGAASGSPALITVSLDVISSGGVISVTTNKENASFLIEGPASYSGSGMSWSVNDAPEGAYKITFNPIKGYRTPRGSEATLAAGGAISFNGIYGRLPSIVVSMGDGPQNSTMVKIFDSNGVYTNVGFEAFPGARRGANVAVGDVDGDGVGEIICGMSGIRNPARVKVFKRDGSPLEGADFTAFQSMAGVEVASADLDGDGTAEIIAINGDDRRSPVSLRVFKYAGGVGGGVSDTGVNVMLASGSAYTIEISGGDIDGDGISEVVFGAASRAVGSGDVTVRALKVDATGGMGAWRASDAGVLITATAKSEVAVGDVDGDGIGEIILGDGASPRHYGASGLSATGSIDIYDEGLISCSLDKVTSDPYGFEIASGSLNDDYISEIVAGLGPGPQSPSTVMVLDSGGGEMFRFDAFENAYYGARVALGDLGY